MPEVLVVVIVEDLPSLPQLVKSFLLEPRHHTLHCHCRCRHVGFKKKHSLTELAFSALSWRTCLLLSTWSFAKRYSQCWHQTDAKLLVSHSWNSFHPSTDCFVKTKSSSVLPWLTWRKCWSILVWFVGTKKGERVAAHPTSSLTNLFRVTDLALGRFCLSQNNDRNDTCDTPCFKTAKKCTVGIIESMQEIKVQKRGVAWWRCSLCRIHFWRQGRAFGFSFILPGIQTCYLHEAREVIAVSVHLHAPHAFPAALGMSLMLQAFKLSESLVEGTVHCWTQGSSRMNLLLLFMEQVLRSGASTELHGHELSFRDRSELLKTFRH